MSNNHHNLTSSVAFSNNTDTWGDGRSSVASSTTLQSASSGISHSRWKETEEKLFMFLMSLLRPFHRIPVWICSASLWYHLYCSFSLALDGGKIDFKFFCQKIKEIVMTMYNVVTHTRRLSFWFLWRVDGQYSDHSKNIWILMVSL